MENPVWTCESPAADAVAICSALEAAEALEKLIRHFSSDNLVMVDVCGGTVSYQQNNCCLLFNPLLQPPIQFVQTDGLPLSFVTVSGDLNPHFKYYKSLRCMLMISEAQHASRFNNYVLHVSRQNLCSAFNEPMMPRRAVPLDALGQRYKNNKTATAAAAIKNNNQIFNTVPYSMLDTSGTIVMPLNGVGHCSPSLHLCGTDTYVAGIRMASGCFYWEVKLGSFKNLYEVHLGVCTNGFITLRSLSPPKNMKKSNVPYYTINARASSHFSQQS
jgi:hypothetical protein